MWSWSRPPCPSEMHGVSRSTRCRVRSSRERSGDGGNATLQSDRARDERVAVEKQKVEHGVERRVLERREPCIEQITDDQTHAARGQRCAHTAYLSASTIHGLTTEDVDW